MAVIPTAARTARSGTAGPRSTRPGRNGSPTARRRLAAWGFNSAGGWSLSPQVLRLPTIIDLELGRQARFHWFDPFAAGDRNPDDGARPQARRALSRRPLSDRLFLRQRGRLVGRRVVCVLFDAAGRLGDQTALGRGAAPALCRQLASLRRRFCAAGRGRLMGAAARRHPNDPNAAGRRGDPCGARMDRDRRPPLLRARRQGDPRRRPRCALFRRPAADLLRPGGGAGDGPLCRRDRHQLQCRQQRRLDRPLLFRGLEEIVGRQAGAGLRMVLCRPATTAPATATTAI